MIDTHNIAFYTLRMAAKDVIHDAVKRALINDGWHITADPYTLKYGEDLFYADLAAEKVIAAERGNDKIIVEIKSFTGRSQIQDVKLALGQYRLYLPVLAEIAPEYQLYLAVSDEVFNNALQREAVKLAIAYNKVYMIVVDIVKEEIVQWVH